MKRLMHHMAFSRARRGFNARRESFYIDLAEAIDDNESITLFFAQRRDFCVAQGLSGMRLIYDTMLLRLNEKEGRLSHVLEPIVPSGDMVSLAANDHAQDDRNRADDLRSLATSITRGRMMFAILRKALAGPAMAAPVIIAFPILIALFFIPQYEAIAPPSEWGRWGRSLYAFSMLLRTHGVLLAAMAPAGAYAFFKSFSLWRGSLRKRFDRHLPYSLYRDFVGTSFLTALARLTKARVGISEALAILEEKATPWLAWHIGQIRDNLQARPDDYAAAFDTGLFAPDIHLRLVTYAERSRGDFSEGLTRLGTDGLVYVHASVERSGSRLTVAALLVAVAVLAYFYGGNTMISRNVSQIVQERTDALSY
ncbi:hypothetical protein [Noviherbaspirillum pedocola]|uniref:General secretion pathway protein n=1 Tax=Noviherbaspirillum pedocola TaxID=2801341 RepID=A0A934SV04_9BURK|nr:hypothetical protein [Noviherbaspirillum pedocola]MBK4736084.1 hypothetical protein [Noviherbaspirillum pedocola]